MSAPVPGSARASTGLDRRKAREWAERSREQIRSADCSLRASTAARADAVNTRNRCRKATEVNQQGTNAKLRARAKSNLGL